MLPCPTDEMHAHLCELINRLLLDLIKSLTKAKKTSKRELDMTEKFLHRLFHAIGSTFTELCKQVQECSKLLLPFCTSKNPLIFQHDNSQESLEFASEIVQATCYVFHLMQLHRMGSDVRLGLPSQGFFSSSHALGLPFYLWCLLMQHFYSTINSLLRFLAFMQHMPNISLMNTLWSNLAHGTLNCFSSITQSSSILTLALASARKEVPSSLHLLLLVEHWRT